jgi:hypothetical protein
MSISNGCAQRLSAIQIIQNSFRRCVASGTRLALPSNEPYVTGLLRRWRRSILLQVTSLSIAISLIVIATVGTLLYTKIAAGVYHEKNSAAISEAQSLADYTQGQLDATRYRSDILLQTVIDNIFKASQVSPTHRSARRSCSQLQQQRKFRRGTKDLQTMSYSRRFPIHCVSMFGRIFIHNQCA